MTADPSLTQRTTQEQTKGPGNSASFLILDANLLPLHFKKISGSRQVEFVGALLLPDFLVCLLVCQYVLIFLACER